MYQFQLLLDAEVDEIGIDEDGVWRSESFVELEEEGGGNLGTVNMLAIARRVQEGNGEWREHFANNFGRFILFGDFSLLFELILLQTRIPGGDDALDLSKLASFLCGTHDCL